jgi:eukaryotic-like serine/threonine-protein kinase
VRVAVEEPTRADAILDGRYKLRQRRGRGGMGSVWDADDLKLQRLVAVKIISRSKAQSPEALARFDREARAVAKLQSPHIVQVYDYGVWRDRPFMVMELLEGEDLKTRLKRVGRLPLHEVVRIGVQLGTGLAAAHAAGIVHRDLKPANVFMVKQVGGAEVVKVFDFGLAKALEDTTTRQLTKDGSFLGTPHYMSPEQMLGEVAVDERADVWSLGVILFRSLTGRLPFDGPDLAELVANVLHDPPPPLSSLGIHDLPAETDGFFARALAKERDARFASAIDTTQALVALSPADTSAVSRPIAEPASEVESVSAMATTMVEPSIERISVVPDRRAPRIVVAVLLGVAAIFSLLVLALRRGPSEAPDPAPGRHDEPAPAPPLPEKTAAPTPSATSAPTATMSAPPPPAAPPPSAAPPPPLPPPRPAPPRPAPPPNRPKADPKVPF